MVVGEDGPLVRAMHYCFAHIPPEEVRKAVTCKDAKCGCYEAYISERAAYMARHPELS